MKITAERLYSLQSSRLTATQGMSLRQGHGPPCPPLPTLLEIEYFLALEMKTIGDRIFFGMQYFDFAQI